MARERFARRPVRVADCLAVLVISIAAELTITPSIAATASSEPKSGAAVAEIVGRIDQTLADELNSFSNSTGRGAAPLVDDAVFVRRAYLDLVGELPTPNEYTIFTLDPAADKRGRLVEQLLADQRFGRNWGRYWRDVILYRRGDERALITARPAEDFFANAMNENMGWDKIARNVIEARGNVYDEGRTVLIMAQQADANDIASEVSRIFMGVQISCAQCHDHPTDRWKRSQFHEFAAFFPRVQLRPIFNEGRVRGFEVASMDSSFRFRAPDQPGRGSLEHYMPDLKDPSSRGTVMTPAFFATGQKLPTGTPDAERRETIARWITSPQNGWFAKAFVNRTWAELVGEGFYEPVDDLGPDRKCSAPKTLDLLAAQFASHHYNVKWLFRTIMATKTYQRQSRPRRNPDETPFLANCTQRLRADQVFENLVHCLGSPPVSASNYSNTGPSRAITGRMVFGMVFGYDPSDRRDEVSGSIPQALALMNSSQMASVINARNPQTLLGKLLADQRDDEDAIVELYLLCLAREPSSSELKISRDYVNGVGNRAEAFEDLQWALLNRSEFLHRN
ncbi:MAG TPA: DUF1549 domain-containing protein [Pirellulales bacterium]|nr:DUF1549 domain-containing protein [Pirellulales bacterium]